VQRQMATLTELARIGFADLSESREVLDTLQEVAGVDPREFLEDFRVAADPDQALRAIVSLARVDDGRTAGLLADPVHRVVLLRLAGASQGLVEFFERHPDELDVVTEPADELPSAAQIADDLLATVHEVDGFASAGAASAGGTPAARAAGAAGASTDVSGSGASRSAASSATSSPAWSEDRLWTDLRIRYRRWLVRIAAFDLSASDASAVLDRVATRLADAAGAALEASLAVARTHVTMPGAGPARFTRDEVALTRFAIIGMGKAGANELNYVSDVDVIFVAEGDEEGGLENAKAVDIATRLAVLTMRGISEAGFEPPLWEVDPNLRPEGKQGALVRTLDSHIAYYERWAKSWEFQALLKARPLAGDPDLGQRYVDALWPKVWSSASRENFVDSVQRMRERVTDNIPSDELHYQLKLGPGGLRDIEFTVQLLQLVHGQSDESVHERGTIRALGALSESGYIGRVEAAGFAQDYRLLRVLEHRLQLSRLRRTHLMPRDDASLRVLARASGLATTGHALVTRWESTKNEVRTLHERLFYRPLLSAVAALPEDEVTLSPKQAEARLAAIGFRDARGALSHIQALTGGVSRRATIQRHLLPVMLRWFADGADPDYGLLAFRRLSESLGGTHWFLRMLRDSSGVAERLTRVLSGSRYIGELLDQIPEASAWLEDDRELKPRSLTTLRDEASSILRRHADAEPAAKAIMRMRRRELLRLAISSVLGVVELQQLGAGLTDVTTATLDGVLRAIRRRDGLGPDALEFAVIGMGRYGGGELGFGSDADLLYVFRATSGTPEATTQAANAIVKALSGLTEDHRVPLDLDTDLRPEGKNGPQARSLDSYRAYYERWSLTWEAQALLRARGVAGDEKLLADFEALADTVRYPSAIAEQAVREVKRIKARVENERLPQGADPTRHVKLGRGSLSDVEWFVQLMQLEHAAAIPDLRTTSTLDALAVVAREHLVPDADAERLREAWLFASRLRSSMTLWLNKTTDVLPGDRRQLEGIARVMEYPPGSATQLEQDYLAVTRRARRVFEQRFYGLPDRIQPSTA